MTNRLARFHPSLILLGFAMGGFFDGILLHQILQWHHLLTAIDPGNLRMQVAADGIFHAGMYVLAAASLWRLYQLHRRGRVSSGSLAARNFLIGFGLWHLVDALLSHWLLGIHRIRMDSETPLLWDIGWLAAFGLLPLMLAWLIGRGKGPDGHSSAAVILCVVSLTAIAGALAAFPPRGASFTTVLFQPGMEPSRIMTAIGKLDAKLVWIDGTGEVAVLELPPGAWPSRLYFEGALLVTGAGLPPGCFDNIRI